MAGAYSSFLYNENRFGHLHGLVLVALLLQSIQASPCGKKVQSCPKTTYEVEERKRSYKCSYRYFYTCLPTDNYTYFERCSPEFLILNGTGGCPYIVKCDNTLGFIFGNVNTYKRCPETAKGCPPVYHDTYRIQDLYKYPACFYKDGVIPQISSMKPEECPKQERSRTTGNSEILIVFLVAVLVISIVVVVIVIFLGFHRRRKKNTENEGNPITMETDAGSSGLAVSAAVESEVHPARTVMMCNNHMASNQEEIPLLNEKSGEKVLNDAVATNERIEELKSEENYSNSDLSGTDIHKLVGKGEVRISTDDFSENSQGSLHPDMMTGTCIVVNLGTKRSERDTKQEKKSPFHCSKSDQGARTICQERQYKLL